MKLLSRLASLGGSAFDGSNLFSLGGSPGLRRSSIHLVPSSGRPREPSDSPGAAAGKDPSWVLLNRRDCRRITDDDSMGADNKTVADSRTSTGQQRLRVWFRRAAPPASSFLYYDYMGRTVPDGEKIALAVIAAHGDSVVLRMKTSTRRPSPYEHFVYMAVAHHCLLHLGRSQWELKRSVPIVHEEGDELVGWSTGTSMAIPVGDRFLCWVSYHARRASFILCDMAAEEASPRLRHVPLPSFPYYPNYYTNDLLPLTDSEGMGASGSGAVRFVAIEPRCCCGRFGRTSCARSRYAFTVTTWTLTLIMDEPLMWVKDGVFDCEELWAMPGYEGLPRGHLQSPAMSLDNPDVMCFKVGRVHKDQDMWMIQVDTRRKALLAAVPWRSHLHLPAKL